MRNGNALLLYIFSLYRQAVESNFHSQKTTLKVKKKEINYALKIKRFFWFIKLILKYLVEHFELIERNPSFGTSINELECRAATKCISLEDMAKQYITLTAN